MSTGFSTRKMRRGAARSSSSAVPRTTAQRSTSRSSHSAVPRTPTARTSTLSAEQQRLRVVAACLPMWYSYGNEQLVHLLHPRVTTLQEENQPATTGSSPVRLNDKASSSPILPEVSTSACKPSEQPFTGPLHQTTSNMFIIR